MCLDWDLQVGHFLATRTAFNEASYMVASFGPVVSVPLKPFDCPLDSVMSHCGIVIPSDQVKLVLGYIILVVGADDIYFSGLPFETSLEKLSATMLSLP